MNIRIAKNIERSTRSNVVATNANDFVRVVFEAGGKIRKPQAPGEAWRVEMTQPGGNGQPDVPQAFWFTLKGSGVEATILDIYGADVNLLQDELSVEIHQPYAEGVDKVRNVELPQAGPEPKLVLPEEQTAYHKTLPRRLSASAGRSDTWMPDSAAGKDVQTLRTKIGLADLANAQAAAGARAEADRLIEKFLGTVEERRAEMLEMYAAAYLSHTGLKPDECKLVQWTDEAGAIHLKFVPSEKTTRSVAMEFDKLRSAVSDAINTLRGEFGRGDWPPPRWAGGLIDRLESAQSEQYKKLLAVVDVPLNVPDIDLSGHPVDVLDRLAKSSGRLLAPDWDQQIEALRTAYKATVKPDGAETLHVLLREDGGDVDVVGVFFPGTSFDEAVSSLPNSTMSVCKDVCTIRIESGKIVGLPEYFE